MTAPSKYVLEAFREGADSTIYRGRQRGSSTPVLAVAIGYSLAAALELHGQLSLWRSHVTKGRRSSYSKTLAVSPGSYS
jgi:hypothetical protein